jgi:hypothetical protein
MLEKEQWKEGDKVYGLPKLKTIRIKIKKEKAAEKPEAEGVTAEGAAPQAGVQAPAPGTAKVKAPTSAEKKEK